MAAAGGPVAILAGSGLLPALLVDALASRGEEARVLAFRGFAQADLRRRADAVVDLLDVERALAHLDAWRPRAVALAGGVGRPSPGAALNALAWARNRAELEKLLARGDDSLLRGVVALLEERGFTIVAAHALAPDLLAPEGLIAGSEPDAAARAEIALGRSALAALSPFDVGQALVVAGERVLAVEGPEGTDAMLARVRALRAPRVPGASLFAKPRAACGVLVKTAKAGQDLRVDLPAIGPRTVIGAARAGLSGLAVGAGATLVIDRAGTIAEAARRGLFLVGMPPLAGTGEAEGAL